MPKVVVVTPIYATRENGRAELFEDTLKSMHRLQDDFLYLVVDDGSPNQEGVKEVIAGYPDDRVRYMERERQEGDRETASNALNFGINSILDGKCSVISPYESTSIDVITFLHSDDLMIDLGGRLKAIQNGACAVMSDQIKFDNNGYARLKRGRKIDVDEFIREGNSSGINHHTFMWKRKFAEMMKSLNTVKHKFDGLFHPCIRYGEDRAVAKLTIRLAYLTGVPLHYVEGGCVAYRSHGESITGEIDFEERNRDRRIVDEIYFQDVKERREGKINKWLFEMNRPLSNPFRRLGTLLSGRKDFDLINKLIQELDSIEKQTKEAIPQALKRG